MLNAVLRSKIEYPEFRLIYDSKMRLTSPDVLNALQIYIKNLRAQSRAPALVADKFAAKLAKFGNEGGWYKAKVRELEKIIFDEQKGIPDTNHGEWRSIEFEVLFKSADSKADFVKAIRAARYHTKNVTIKDDGSLRTDEEDRAGICNEVCVSYKSGEEKIVRDVCALLSKCSYVNNSCGTHVHFDMRNVDEKTVKQYGKRIARCAPALKMLLPKSRRENKYCATNINDMRGNGDRNSRYAFVNLQAYTKYKTLEVRGHSATTRADKILNWIKLCEKIMTSRIRARTEEITDPQELIKVFKFDTDMVEYINERQTKFNNIVLPKIVLPAPVDIPLAPGVVAIPAINAPEILPELQVILERANAASRVLEQLVSTHMSSQQD